MHIGNKTRIAFLSAELIMLLHDNLVIAHLDRLIWFNPKFPYSPQLHCVTSKTEVKKHVRNENPSSCLRSSDHITMNLFWDGALFVILCSRPWYPTIDCCVPDQECFRWPSRHFHYVFSQFCTELKKEPVYTHSVYTMEEMLSRQIFKYTLSYGTFMKKRTNCLTFEVINVPVVGFNSCSQLKNLQQ